MVTQTKQHTKQGNTITNSTKTQHDTTNTQYTKHATQQNKTKQHNRYIAVQDYEMYYM